MPGTAERALMCPTCVSQPSRRAPGGIIAMPPGADRPDALAPRVPGRWLPASAGPPPRRAAVRRRPAPGRTAAALAAQRYADWGAVACGTCAGPAAGLDALV